MYGTTLLNVLTSKPTFFFLLFFPPQSWGFKSILYFKTWVMFLKGRGTFHRWVMLLQMELWWAGYYCYWKGLKSPQNWLLSAFSCHHKENSWDRRELLLSPTPLKRNLLNEKEMHEFACFSVENSGVNRRGPEPKENQLWYSHAKSKFRLSCCYFLSFLFLTVADLKNENGEHSWTYRSLQAAEAGMPEEWWYQAHLPRACEAAWGSPILD